MASTIDMIEGSSVDPATVAEVIRRVGDAGPVMVVLDSNHSHDHVLAELRMYSPLVSAGSYLVVFDTVVEELPSGMFPNRPWDQGSNPYTAVQAFLAETPEFVADDAISNKLLLSVARGGYLRRR